MRISGIHIAAGLMMGLLVAGSTMTDQSTNQAPYGHGNDTRLPYDVIGISVRVGAERIGDLSVLYVGYRDQRSHMAARNESA